MINLEKESDDSDKCGTRSLLEMLRGTAEFLAGSCSDGWQKWW